MIKHCIRVISEEKKLAFIIQVQKKASKYIAVAYATDVAYATFPSIIIMGLKNFLCLLNPLRF